MPITPHYHLTQTHRHISIHVSIPHVRVSPKTLELIVDGSELHLYAPPTYLLKLVLPADVVDESLYEQALEGRVENNGSDNGCIPTSLAEDITAGDSGARRLVQEISAEETATSENRTGKSTPQSTAEQLQWTEEDLPKMQYDPLRNHGTIIITLRKVQDGLWGDLDLLGRLQQPLQKETKSLVCCVEDSDKAKAVLDDNHIVDELKSINQGSLCYGLFRTFHNVFTDYARAGLADEMLECPNPDEIHSNYGDGEDGIDRRSMRLEMENDKFDSERYLDDTNLEVGDDMIYDTAMEMVPHWVDTSPPTTSNGTARTDSSAFFTQDESHLLATLTQCEIPFLTKDQRQSTLLSLSDILFAYAYDHRTTDGEPTIESSWTIMILSPTLSWLEAYNAPYDSIGDVMRWCIRRSLIYPYLRNYDLAMKVVCDVATILIKGRRAVLRCLLQVHSIMEKSECHYLFNKLYVDPMIWWIQSCDEEVFQGFGREIQRALSLDLACKAGWSENESNVLSKQYLSLGLVELEEAQSDDNDNDTVSESSNSTHDETNKSCTDDSEEEVVQLIQSLDIKPERENTLEK